MSGTVHYFESSYILNICNVHDPRYDELAAKFDHAATIDEAKRMTQELDRYTLENHFELMISPSVRYTIWQPYLKGYSGEYLGPGSNAFSWLANLWIDQDMKKSMKR